MTNEQIVEKILQNDYHGTDILYIGDEPTRGDFHVYNGSAGLWSYLRPNSLYKSVLQLKSDIKKSARTDILEKLAIWTDREIELNPNKNLINLKNGMFNLSSKELISHDRKYYSSVQLPFEYDPRAMCPKWEAFLSEIFPKDNHKDSIKVIQEMFGYVFTPDASFHKAFIFQGGGKNGKSTVTNMLLKMLGKDNFTVTMLRDLGRGSSIINFKNKLFNVCDETAENLAIESDIFKKLVSGEEVQGEAKFKAPEMFRPFVRIAILTNNLPRIDDHSLGMWRRIILIPFPYQVPQEKRVRDFEKTMFDELAGIFNWSMTGLDRLKSNDRFTDSLEMRKALYEYKLDNNNPALFIEEVYLNGGEKNNVQVTSIDFIYERYEDWVKDSGFKPFSKRRFVAQIIEFFNPGHEKANILRVKMRQGTRGVKFIRKSDG